jgi:hypothetical protein
VAPGKKHRKCAVCSAEWLKNFKVERKALYAAARAAGLSWRDAVLARDGKLPMPA